MKVLLGVSQYSGSMATTLVLLSNRYARLTNMDRGTERLGMQI